MKMVSSIFISFVGSGHTMLFHCDFYTLFTNPGYYDGALLGRERNVAIY